MKKKLFIMLLDVLIINCGIGLAFLIRYDFQLTKVPSIYFDRWLYFAPICAGITIGTFYLFHLYHYLWTHINLRELPKIVLVETIVFMVNAGISVLLQITFPLSVYFIAFLFIVSFDTLVRYLYRIWLLVKCELMQHQSQNQTRTMVIGAGAAGKTIMKELLESEQLNTKVCCVIDDKPENWGRFLEGVCIAGGCDLIEETVQKYDITQIIFAIPSASGNRKKEILNICQKTGCVLKTVPGIYQLVNGEANIQSLRSVEPEDLLGREPVCVNNEKILNGLNGKTILVTGGGGSIGSELCRQIANKTPKQLIIFDVYENNAYEIQQELKRNHSKLNLTVLIGSVRDEKRIQDVFCTYQPQIVFHAAAHKHVPLMEESPKESVKNNVFGTYKTAMAAIHNQVERFVLISTDKAVNPTNIMGASKRICEMLIQTLNQKSKTEFVAVRFGNVLGSNGSVIPLFKKQIAAGGPVTVTHPKIVRYFMTIPEAVSLVLQASANAKGGEIFVLDMGEPVKIADLAQNLIRLSGHVPNEDIKIVYTGLRPGEKLYEEILMDEEGLQNTENQRIFIGKPIELEENQFMNKLEELKAACESSSADIKQLVAGIVKTYQVDQCEQGGNINNVILMPNLMPKPAKSHINMEKSQKKRKETEVLQV